MQYIWVGLQLHRKMVCVSDSFSEGFLESRKNSLRVGTCELSEEKVGTLISDQNRYYSLFTVVYVSALCV